MSASPVANETRPSYSHIYTDKNPVHSALAVSMVALAGCGGGDSDGGDGGTENESGNESGGLSGDN